MSGNGIFTQEELDFLKRRGKRLHKFNPNAPYIVRTRKNKSGIFRVSKIKKNDSQKGYAWRYQFQQDKNLFSFTTVNLKKLEQRIKSEGLPWVILDKERAEKSYRIDQE